MSVTTREELLAELAILEAKNEAATHWGAAVGARHERIKAIEGILARATEKKCRHDVSQDCPACMQEEIERLRDIARRVAELPYFKNARVESLVRDAKDVLAMSPSDRDTQ